MLNNASKFGAGVAVFGVVAMAASRLVGGDRIGAILFVGLAIAGAVVAFGSGRSVGPDLAPFVGADAAAAATPVDPADAPAGSLAPIVVAIGATVALCGGALGPRWVIVGGLAATVGVAVWLFDTLRAPGVLAERDVRNVDNRLLGPIALPVGAFLLAISIAFSFSRVLLAIPDTASWVLAFVVAALLLTALSAIASRRPATRVVAVIAGAGLLGVWVAGGAGASVGERNFEKRGVDQTPKVALVAANISYDRKVIGLPANTNVEVDFTNLDVGTFHNFAVYNGDPGTPIFNGKPTARSKTQDYTFRTPAPGTYRYVCDFHPAMTGELRVTAAQKEPKS